MVRTADSSVRVGGKAPKKGGNSTSTNGSSRSRSPSSSGERGFSSYNSVCQRETPNWQKPITTFFTHVDKTTKQDTKQSTSKRLEPDITMVDDDNQQLQANTNDETMEQEYTPLQVDSGSSVVNEEDKENLRNQSNDKSSNENTENHDMEMNEINEITKKKVNLRDDDDHEDAAPKKKRKLDANMYKQLKKLEQAEVMFS